MKHEIELAWAGGLFVGEGCFIAHQPGRRQKQKYLIATLAMCDLRAIKRLHRLCNYIFARHGIESCKIYVADRMPSRPKNLKSLFRVSFTGTKAEILGSYLRPYMGNTDKRDQFDRAAKEAGLRKRKGIYGHDPRYRDISGAKNLKAKLTPQEVGCIRRMISQARRSGKRKDTYGIVKNLSSRFKVTPSTLHRIARMEIWNRRKYA